MLSELQKYATAKTYSLMQDIVQFSDVIGLETGQAAACTGSTFLRLAATIAVQQKASRDDWIRMCTLVFDRCAEIDKEESK
jgi:hypothetical protein